MRHRKSGRKLNRNHSHRKAMFRNMTCSLIEHKIIKTTLPKAKELRRVIEPLITRAKKSDNTANRRYAFNYLRNDAAVATLFNDIAVRSKNRNGGYIRILKCGFRTGDKAPMAFIELVDREGAVKLTKKKAAATKSSEKKVKPSTSTDIKKPKGVKKFDNNAAKTALGKKIKENDLTIIEGIGPKIAEIFVKAGITTWAELGNTDTKKCKEILAKAGDRYKMHDPDTWPRQAKLAADGKWQELADWKNKLDSGREVKK